MRVLGVSGWENPGLVYEPLPPPHTLTPEYLMMLLEKIPERIGNTISTTTSYKVYLVFPTRERFGELPSAFYLMSCTVPETKDMAKKKVSVDDAGSRRASGVKFVGLGCFFINE